MTFLTFLYSATAVIVLLIIARIVLKPYWKEDAKRKSQLATYAKNGGEPYVFKRHWTRKDKTWEEQDEINRTARYHAGLQE